jgi:hypothetical protein
MSSNPTKPPRRERNIMNDQIPPSICSDHSFLTSEAVGESRKVCLLGFSLIFTAVIHFDIAY